MQDRPVEAEITPEMIEACADRLFEISPECTCYEHGAREIYLAMERAKRVGLGLPG